ncbi:hypothetical protein CFHF_23240 [Caulobacter flavus]|uniref:Uncharacterized protein n=1 Tax=Caulobacter flavus TaxID=1679497 RepID=A0A2N5CMC1_9CAUL|nr:hypothetical protein [Caulobacter flavus]AYV44795.1 hypothetical protein C1707_00125 [Caulobacter flavus]PLR07135.1 hypothetical protein CFHF_23240 [Caulobacter flavus]
MKTLRILAALACLAATPAVADGPPKPAEEPKSEARTFPYDDGVVELLIIGPAARLLYDRLPGKGKTQACGASGLHKGDGQITCSKEGGEYACRVWLDAKKQTLAQPESDDC